jgi:hypothetical protein
LNRCQPAKFKQQGGKESAEELTKRGTEHELQTYASPQQGSATRTAFLANSLQETHHDYRAASFVDYGQRFRFT